MSEPMIPAGAFVKAGNAPAPAPTPEPKAEFVPKTITRKAEPEVSESSESEPPKDLTPAEKKIWKLKADGEEFEFDATDEEAVKREIMKARGANKKFESASAMKKQAETFFEMIKNPESLKKVLTDPRVGIDLKKFAQDYVWEQIQEGQLTDEQKIQREKDRKLAEYEERENSEKMSKAELQKQAEQAHYEETYSSKITQALDVGGIPKTPATVSKMADYLYRSLEQGLDLSPEQLVQQVRNDYLSDFSSVFSAADGEQLYALIGEANAEKLRKADLKRLRSTQGNPFPQRQRDRSAAAPTQAKKLGATEWSKDLISGFLSRK